MKDYLKLKADYNRACNALLEEFCRKHEFEYETYWVAGDVGTIACLQDYYYVDMQTIIADLEMDAPEEEFDKWYEYCLELGLLGDRQTPNFKSWLRGCPRKSPEQIEELKELKQKVEDSKRIFEETLKFTEAEKPATEKTSFWETVKCK